MAGHSDRTREMPAFDPAPKIAIVIAAYYDAISTAQLDAARRVLDGVGAAHETVEVPGSLEIPPAIVRLNRLGDYDGYVALGCVIRGATSHYDVVVNESARGLTLLGLQGLAIGNGIITVETMAQAEERADAARLNTAGGAAEAALHLIALERRLTTSPSTFGFARQAPGQDRP